MTRNQIASKLAKLEGGKSQARIGDLRQILKLLVQLEAEAQVNGEGGPIDSLYGEAQDLSYKMRVKAAKKKVKK
jgi:hypothetical protein